MGLLRTPPGWVIVVIILTLLGLHWRYIFNHPTPTMIFTIQHITASRKLTLEEYAVAEPDVDIDSVLVSAFCTDDERMRMRRARMEAFVVQKSTQTEITKSTAGSPGFRYADPALKNRRKAPDTDVVSGDEGKVGTMRQLTATPTSSNDAGSTARKLPFATKRYGTKLHMINTLIVVTDYPFSFYLIEKMNMAAIPGLTPNLLSLIHLGFGCLSGFFFIKAAKVVLARKAETEENLGHESPEEMPNFAETRPSPSSSKLTARTPLGMGPAASSDTLSPITLNGNKIMTPHAESQSEIGSLLGQPPAVLAAAAVVVDEDDGKERAVPVKVIGGDQHERSPLELKYVRWGCYALMMRNFIDTMDGVLARVQKERRGDKSATQLGYGLNGHTVDVITDILGVTVALVCALYYVTRCEPFVSRIISTLLVRLGFRWHLSRQILFGKIVALAGLGIPAFIGGTWEEYMMAHSNLFDNYANSDPTIFALEQSFSIRLNQFLWSLTCGDSTVSVMVIGIFFNKIWPVAQYYCFMGYLVFVSIVLYSVYVWNAVILANPVAAGYIQELEKTK